MSCENTEDIDCSHVLNQMYEYLHSELDASRLEQIHEHLASCGQCWREYGVEHVVEDLIHRACACTPAPEGLRSAIIARITQLRDERGHLEPDPAPGQPYLEDVAVAAGADQVLIQGQRVDRLAP